MFGTNSPVNSQINMYVMSRVLFGLARLSVEKKLIPDFEYSSQLYGALTWAFVMWLFEFHAPTLQKSLVSSMTYLYHDSDGMPQNGQSLIDWLITG